MDEDEVTELSKGQDAYSFIGRESQDKSIRYLLGSLKPGETKPKLKSTSIETQKGLWDWSNDGNYLLMQPGTVTDYAKMPVGELFAQCTTEVNGLQALSDGASRGVSFVEPSSGAFALVRMQKGMDTHVEYIPLTAQQIKKFKSDKKIKNTKSNDYSISYTTGEKDKNGNYKLVKGDVPSSLLQLAIDTCGYEPPFKLTKTSPVKAELVARDYTGKVVAKQTIEDAAKLKTLNTMLRSLTSTSAGKCEYMATLVLTYEDGTEKRFYKATDSSGNIMVGSGASRKLSEKNNKAFWNLFLEVRKATMWKTGS